MNLKPNFWTSCFCNKVVELKKNPRPTNTSRLAFTSQTLKSLASGMWSCVKVEPCHPWLMLSKITVMQLAHSEITTAFLQVTWPSNLWHVCITRGLSGFIFLCRLFWCSVFISFAAGAAPQSPLREVQEQCTAACGAHPIQVHRLIYDDNGTDTKLHHCKMQPAVVWVKVM